MRWGLVGGGGLGRFPWGEALRPPVPSLGQAPGGGSMGRNLGHSLVSTLSQTGAWYERGFEIPGLRTSVPHWDLSRSPHPRRRGQHDQLVLLLGRC